CLPRTLALGFQFGREGADSSDRGRGMAPPPARWRDAVGIGRCARSTAGTPRTRDRADAAGPLLRVGLAPADVRWRQARTPEYRRVRARRTLRNRLWKARVHRLFTPDGGSRV